MQGNYKYKNIVMCGMRSRSTDACSKMGTCATHASLAPGSCYLSVVCYDFISDVFQIKSFCLLMSLFAIH